MKKNDPGLGFSLWLKLRARKYVKLTKQAFNIKGLKFLSTLLFTIWGIYLSCNSNFLAKASYELSKNDSTQLGQLKKLDEIVKKNGETIDTLVNIIKKLESQNSLLFIQNQLIGTQLNETTLISENILKQLDLAKKSNEKNKIDSLTTLKRNKQRILRAVSRIKDTLDHFTLFHDVFEGDSIYTISDEAKIRVNNILFRVKELLIGEFDNDYLIYDIELYSFWRGFLKNIENLIFRLNMYGLASKSYGDRIIVNSILAKCFKRFVTIDEILKENGNREFFDFSFELIEY